MPTESWATIGVGVIIVFGWIVEATIKWAAAWAWSHLPEPHGAPAFVQYPGIISSETPTTPGTSSAKASSALCSSAEPTRPHR